MASEIIEQYTFKYLMPNKLVSIFKVYAMNVSNLTLSSFLTGYYADHDLYDLTVFNISAFDIEYLQEYQDDLIKQISNMEVILEADA